ncbi:Tetratricopeptide TPR_2 repeat protein [Opitutus terrae PB90-1]|uniref:Tetratricopeptide TPR_2 repeat protein n=2 Tax=Opitutus terrae TaxID=107709 RepID=B1ZS34_OPITP|nr:Tetratricopeptide TPR_2 repeat protein [Opitutus terrae PB90-1]
MSCRVFVAAALLGLASLRAQESESLAERGLKQLIEQQQALMAEAAKENPKFDEEAFAQQMEQVCRGYEALLRANPNLAQGYAAYGYLLSKLDQRKQAIVMLLKANELDPNQPLVKNQIGNYLAEEGKPLEAVNYFLAAIKLAPREPLYHYQLGTLLHEARDDFITSGEWKADAIDRAIHHAFRQAAELAPDRIEFTYRYAESFYEMNPPDWDGALKAWSELEEKAPTPVERETMRLHAANVLIKQDKRDHARALLETVQEPALQTQKQKLLDQLAKPAES